MTRLKTGDIAGIAAELPRYESELRQRTGCGLRRLAVEAAGGGEAAAARSWAETSAAVIPITSGEGIIGAFAETVAAIVAYLGVDCIVTARPDVRGLAEAYERRVDLILVADDHRFIAVNTRTRRVVDNAAATGLAFARVLHRLNRGFAHRRCLVLGCGPVGGSAAAALLRLGYRVALGDLDQERARDLQRQTAAAGAGALHLEPLFAERIGSYRAILDATPAAGIITADAVAADTVVSAPGVPRGVTEAARRKLGNRFFHDPLQLGVATMVALAREG